MLKEITNQAKTAAEELIAAAKIKDGALMVVGCSSSEICGSRLGTNSSVETAQAVFDGLYPVLKKERDLPCRAMLRASQPGADCRKGMRAKVWLYYCKRRTAAEGRRFLCDDCLQGI